MALKDILNDRTKYADDMIVTLPDGTTATLGEYRSLDASDRNALIQRQNTLAQAEQVLAQRVNALLESGLVNPDLTPRQIEQQNRQTAASTFGLREDDPLLGEVAKEMKRLQDQSEARAKTLQDTFDAKLKELNGVVAKAVGVNLNDHYTRQFSSELSALPEDIRGKVKYEDALKYAEENRLMDAAGRYDITRAVDRLTWDAKKEHEMKAIRAQALIDAEKAAAVARMKPSSGLRTEPAKKEGSFDPMTTDNGRSRTKTLDEVLADAAKDVDLWTGSVTN